MSLACLLSSSSSSRGEEEEEGDARMAIIEDDLVDPLHIKHHNRTFIHMAMIASNVRFEYEYGGRTNIVKNLGNLV